MCCNSTIFALATVTALAIAIILIVGSNGAPREGFASDPAPSVYNAARELFASNSAATYSEYKAIIPGADPVQFADIRKLWLSGQLSLDNVRRVL